MVTPLAPQQLAGILPRQAVRMVQDALQAAGCPDADYDARELLRIAAGKDPRLLFDPLTRPQAECLAELAAQRRGVGLSGVDLQSRPRCALTQRRQRGGVRNCH